MASVRLILRKDTLLSDKRHPIILQVIKDKKKAITTLSVRSSESEWNSRTNLPRDPRSALICQKNQLKLQEICLDAEEKNWSAKQIIDVFTGKQSGSLMFFEYSNEMIKGADRTFSTKRTWRTREKKFFKFLGKDIRMNEITHDLLKKYKDHLKGLRSSDRFIEYVRQVYNHSVEYDKFSPAKNPFKKDLFIGVSPSRNRNLTIEETQRLFKLEISGWNRFNGRNLALDFWKLSFLMRGINAVDLAILPVDVGNYYSFTRRKLLWRTDSIQKIKILPEARVIIDKYRDPSRKYVLPFLDNDQTLEDHFQSYESRKHVMTYSLNQIRKELEIRNPISTMSPRYTFINIAKQIGVPFLFIQELVGHKTLSTTDAYLDAFPQEQLDDYHEKIVEKIL